MPGLWRDEIPKPNKIKNLDQDAVSMSMGERDVDGRATKTKHGWRWLNSEPYRLSMIVDISYESSGGKREEGHCFGCSKWHHHKYCSDGTRKYKERLTRHRFRSPFQTMREDYPRYYVAGEWEARRLSESFCDKWMSEEKMEKLMNEIRKVIIV